jgi:hypothetical protein
MSGPRVLLMRLSIRASAKGTEYLSGFLGCARVVAFKAKEPDKYGNEQWEVYVAEPEPKGEQATAPRRDLPVRGQGTWDRARDHDMPTGSTVVHRVERRDPRLEYAEQVVRDFQADEELPF